MNLEDLINQVLNEEGNMAGGPTSVLVSPNSTSTPSQFSGPQVYGDLNDARRPKSLFKGKIQKRPFLDKKRKKK